MWTLIQFLFNQDHGIGLHEYNDYFKWSKLGKIHHWSSRTNNVSDQKLFDEVTFTLPELVRKIDVRHTQEGEHVPKSTPIMFEKNRHIHLFQEHCF